jgi:hypothetical protein
MDVELLITETEKCPVLWDASDETYKDRNEKNDGRMEVATIISEKCCEKNSNRTKNN